MNKSYSTGGVIMSSSRGADGQLSAQDMKDDTVIVIKKKLTPDNMLFGVLVLVGISIFLYKKFKK